MIEYINKKLQEKKLIIKKLNEKEIWSLIDYHADKWIDYMNFPSNCYRLYDVETMNYFWTLNFAYSNKLYQFIIKIYDKIMKNIFKNKWFTFTVVYKKI